MTDLPTYLQTPFYNYYFENGEETLYKVDKLESFFEMIQITYQAEKGDLTLSAFPVDHNYPQTLAYWHIFKNTDKLLAIKFYIQYCTEDDTDFATWLLNQELSLN